MMFCSWGGGGVAKGIRKFAFQLKAEVRFTQLQSIKRLKIDRIVAENSIMVSISPFKILLNNLNGELDQRNLESLVHVCGELIPGGHSNILHFFGNCGCTAVVRISSFSQTF